MTEQNVDSRLKTRDARRPSVLFGLCPLLCCLILAGCAGRQHGDTVTDIGPKQICVGNVERAEAVQAAEDVLTKMRFTIEKADTQTGYIRTRPLPGAQFFELWRKDSVGGANSAEANLHTIQRTIHVELNQRNEGLCIGCLVRTQRLYLPEHEVTSTGHTHEMFSRSTPSFQRMKLNPQQEAGIAWVDLGNDGRLAAEVLARIEKRIAELGKEERI